MALRKIVPTVKLLIAASLLALSTSVFAIDLLPGDYIQFRSTENMRVVEGQIEPLEFYTVEDLSMSDDGLFVTAQLKKVADSKTTVTVEMINVDSALSLGSVVSLGRGMLAH